jgi:hypothetical protein
LRGAVADDLIESALQQVDSVYAADPAGDVSPASLVSVANSLVEAYASAPDQLQSIDKYLVVLSLVQAALTAMLVLDAISDPANARHYVARAARAAERAVRNVGDLERRGAMARADASREDYEVLLGVYGQHCDVVIGDPVACFPAVQTWIGDKKTCNG